MTTETDYAWAAGFFDGDGHSGCYVQNDRHFLRISVGQVQPELLHRFKDIFGVGRVLGPYGPYGNQRRRSATYRYVCSGKAAVAVIQLMAPYMGIHKKRQWNEAVRTRNAGNKKVAGL
jgi:hypothetical protein